MLVPHSGIDSFEVGFYRACFREGAVEDHHSLLAIKTVFAIAEFDESLPDDFFDVFFIVDQDLGVLHEDGPDVSGSLKRCVISVSGIAFAETGDAQRIASGETDHTSILIYCTRRSQT